MHPACPPRNKRRPSRGIGWSWSLSLLLPALSAFAGVVEDLQTGRQALERQQFAQAITVFSQLLQGAQLNRTQRVAALSGRCAAYHQQRLSDPDPHLGALAQRAIADCSQVIALQPDHAPAYRQRGMVYLSMEEPTRALADLEAAVARDPTDHLALQGRGAAKIQIEQWEGAMEDLNAAIQLNPDHPGSYYYRAQLHTAQQNPDLAATDFNTFFQLTQREGGALLQAEQTRMLAANEPQSQAEMLRTLQKDPIHRANRELFRAAPAPVARPTRPATTDGMQDVLSAVIVDATEGSPEITQPSDRAALKGKLCFRVASLQEKSEADKAVAHARRLRVPVFAEQVGVEQRRHTQVWLGPFRNGREAEMARQKMAALGYHPGPITLF
ncbi:MAG: tetratricopeptide repeat protein [Magnetococcus sp. MYC-9]